MGIEQILGSAQGKTAIDQLSSAFGLTPAQTAPALASLGNALSWRIARNTLSRGGIADVVSLLGDRQEGRAAAQSDNLIGADAAEAGNGVLDVLIGDKHVSRGIAARTATDTGIDEDVAKKMLPVVASLMIGELQRQAAPQFARIMRDVPSLMSRNGSPLPLPGEVPMDSGPSGGGSDGSDTTDDSAPPQRPMPPRPARPAGSGSPLPIPGDSIPGVGRESAPDNPYENLPDIIRRGGVQVPGGGALENVIRSILGGLLGFQNRGLLGTLFQLFLIRFLPRLLKSIFSRA